MDEEKLVALQAQSHAMKYMLANVFKLRARLRGGAMLIFRDPR
jgi:hypothetical protein